STTSTRAGVGCLVVSSRTKSFKVPGAPGFWSSLEPAKPPTTQIKAAAVMPQKRMDRWLLRITKEFLFVLHDLLAEPLFQCREIRWTRSPLHDLSDVSPRDTHSAKCPETPG